MNIAGAVAALVAILLLLSLGLLGSTRRSGFWLTIIASIFLTPIGGVLLAIISGPRRYKPPRGDQRRQ